MDVQPFPHVALAEAGETLHDIVCRAYEAERLTIYRYLVSLRLPAGVAQEITQDVFLKLYLTLRDGTEIRTLRAWLFTVASRKFLNWRRDERMLIRHQRLEALAAARPCT